MIVVPVLISTAVAVTVLIKVLTPGTLQDRLDAVRTGLAVGAGIGALITLALALRRQQATEHDATERRLTELYVKAVDQLGSDKAAVRHGGLYALERVAQDNPAHRQTVVDVICAYLRTPYSPPRARGTSKLGGLRAPLRSARTRPQTLRYSLSDATLKDADKEAQQEREVRLTAQRVLRDHLQPRTPARTWLRWFPRPAHTFWPDIDLDLTGATLVDFDLAKTTVRNGWFSDAQFTGVAGFGGAQFSGEARFIRARFDDVTTFSETQFNRTVWFDNARFNRIAWFGGARFNRMATFSKAQFNDAAWFDKTRFDAAWFDETRFNGSASFTGVQFSGSAGFNKAQFSDSVPDEVERYLQAGQDNTYLKTASHSIPDVAM